MKKTPAEGLAADANASAHIFVKLRALHPLVAVVVAIQLLATAGVLLGQRPGPGTRRLAHLLAAMVVTQVLAGVVMDARTRTTAGFIESSRRIGQNWVLEAELRTFSATTEDRPLFSFRFDNFVQLDLAYHF